MDLNLISNPAMVWFVVGLICAVAEFMIPGVVIIFFGAGAWVVALILLAVKINLFLQLVIFMAVSVFCLILLRKQFVQQKKNQPDPTDEFIGKTARVHKGFKSGEFGQVFFKGALWKASTTAAKTLADKEYVKIVGHESIVLQVEPRKTQKKQEV